MKVGLLIMLFATVGIGGYAGWQAMSGTASEQAPATTASVSMAPGLPAESDAPAEPAPQSYEPAPTKSRTRGISVVQQTVGTICETPSGECVVNPAPILSVCYCGSAIGTVTR